MTTILQDYQISYDKKIRQGRFSCIFKGCSKEGQTVAIEDYLTAEECTTVERENLAKLKNIRDRNVTRIFDYGTCESRFYIVREFCEESLDKYLARSQNGQLEEEEIRSIGKQIGSGVNALFRQFIDFNTLDIKNILFGENRCIKISKPNKCDAAALNYLEIYSPVYLAPEIRNNKLEDVMKENQKAVMFSIGAILLHLALGNSYPLKHPIPTSLNIKACTKNVPEHLQMLIRNLLAKNPHDRIPLLDFCAQIRGISKDDNKQFRKFLKQHVEGNHSASKKRNEVVKQLPNTPVKFIRPVRDGLSNPGDRKNGHQGKGNYMVVTDSLEIKNTGSLNNGDVTTGHPVFLAIANGSKSLPVHYDGTAKIDEDYNGPTKRIKIQRQDHVSRYDISEHPTSPTNILS